MIAPANAGVIGDAPALEISLSVNGGPAQLFNPLGQSTGGDTWMWNPTYVDPAWEMECNITADTDPWVNSVIGFTNNTAVANLYTLTVTLPVPAILVPTVMGGSVGGSVTWNGAGGTGGILTYGTGGAGSALFNGQIDFANVLSILPAPGGVAGAFPGNTVNIPATNVGLPGPTIPGPMVAGFIGIQLQFILSAGDAVAISSYFEVQPIPAPAGLALLGLAGITARRRRRE
jgi:hypothetical protein